MPDTGSDPVVEMIIEPRVRPVGDGEVRRILPFRRRRMVGPFIFADVMGPDDLPAGDGADVPAHPHLGMSTLTYLTAGSLLHRDSTGAVQQIDPGAVNWMTAGDGVCHTERTPPQERQQAGTLAGLQAWVALPSEAEAARPFFEHAAAADVPQESFGGAQVRVLAGTGWSMRSPIVGSSPLLQADITLADSTLTIPAEHSERGLIVLSGAVRVAGRALPEAHMAVLQPGERVQVSGTGRLLLLAGEPVGQRYIWWNFVASDAEMIEDAKRRWDEQQFPKVPGDHDTWMPRPQ